MQESVNKLLNEGVIRTSGSPWRAQVFVVEEEENIHKRRLCLDYSHTINIYTELYIYPLPRIDNMVNNHTFFEDFPGM